MQSRGCRDILWRRLRKFCQKETFLFWFFYMLWLAQAAKSTQDMLLTPASVSLTWEHQQVFSLCRDSQTPSELKHRSQYSSHLFLIQYSQLGGFWKRSSLEPSSVLLENKKMPPKFHKLNKCSYKWCSSIYKKRKALKLRQIIGSMIFTGGRRQGIVKIPLVGSG